MSDYPSGDPESWVDRHGDSLYRYAFLRLRAPDLAADVVQETFLEAIRARESFEGRSNERTWLIGILKHKVVDHLRKASREHPGGDDTLSVADADASFDRRGALARRPRVVGRRPGPQPRIARILGHLHGLPREVTARARRCILPSRAR